MLLYKKFFIIHSSFTLEKEKFVLFFNQRDSNKYYLIKKIEIRETTKKFKIFICLGFTIFFLISFSTSVFTIILSRTITLTGYLDTLFKYNGTNITQSQLNELQPVYRVIVGDKNSPIGFFLLGLSILQGVGLLLVLLVVNMIIFYKYIHFLKKIKDMAHKTGMSFFLF